MFAVLSTAGSCASCLGCCICDALLNCALSRCTRLGYLGITVGVFLLSFLLGQYAEEFHLDDIAGSDITRACDGDYEHDCMRNQMVYRASFVMCIFFAFFGVLSACTSVMDKGCWMPKILAPLAALVVALWFPNDMFGAWSELSRAVSFIWLLFQSLLVLEVGFEVHEFLLASVSRAEQSGAGTGQAYLYVYLALCLTFYILGGVGIVLLFVSDHSCGLGNFFASVTLIFGVGTSAASVLEAFSGGLLTPSIAFAYAVYLNWYAMTSSPDAGCNDLASPSGHTQDERDFAATIGVAALLITVGWTAWHGTAVLGIFASSTADGLGFTADYRQALLEAADGGADAECASAGESADDRCCCFAGKPDSPVEVGEHPGAERVFFHVIMMLTVVQACMTLTAWGTPEGQPVGESGSDRPFMEAMWMKIVAQWLMYGFYMRCLYVLYWNNSD